jgi:hypothetical protein
VDVTSNERPVPDIDRPLSVRRLLFDIRTDSEDDLGYGGVPVAKDASAGPSVAYGGDAVAFAGVKPLPRGDVLVVVVKCEIGLTPVAEAFN